jgi:ribonuclease T2
MKQRPVIVLTLLLPLVACNPNPKPTPEPVPRPRATAFAAQPSATQNFDYYLLNLSWSPEFCHSHPNATGPYPQNCSTEPGPRNPAAYSEIYPDPGLLVHEWRTHGTCSGLTPDAFFTLARTAFHSVAIPPALSHLDHQISMPPGQILDLFTAANPSISRSSLALSCGNNYLTAIEVCLNKSAQPTPCGPIRSCRANTVRIPPP